MSPHCSEGQPSSSVLLQGTALKQAAGKEAKRNDAGAEKWDKVNPKACAF